FVRAGARGTSYLVRTFPGGATSIVVFEGAVEVDSTSGAWAPVLLGPGTMALAHPRAPQPMPASTEELARTRDWVEHVASLEPQVGSRARHQRRTAVADVPLPVRLQRRPLRRSRRVPSRRSCRVMSRQR